MTEEFDNSDYFWIQQPSIEPIGPVVDKFNKVEEQYLAVFGEDSLERVMEYPIPYHGPCTLEEIKDFTLMMERAISTKRPIPQIDPEIWEEIVF